MKVIQTLPGDPNFHLFEKFPKELYPPDSIKQKQVDRINSEYLDACYVLIENNQPQARLAIYHNNNLHYKGKNAACIGNYECVDDVEISKQIISIAIDRVKTSGKEFLIGPMNGSTWDDYRFSLHNDNPNFLLEPFHPVYYNTHFLNSGFQPIANYISSIDRVMTFDSENILDLQQKFQHLKVVIRGIDMNDYENELKRLYSFISSAFKNNFLYTPIRWETFNTKYKEAAAIINTKYFLIAEGPQGNILGFIFCYQDLFNLTEKSLVIKTLARDTSRQWAGLAHVLVSKIISMAKSEGYKSVVHAFMHEQGASKGTSNTFSGMIYKNYALYGLQL